MPGWHNVLPIGGSLMISDFRFANGWRSPSLVCKCASPVCSAASAISMPELLSGLVSVPDSKRKKLRLRKSSSRDFVHHPQTSRYVETEIPPSLKYKAQHNEAKLNANRRVLPIVWRMG